MYIINKKILGNTVVSSLLIASVAVAQSNPDDNLLRLLEAIDQEQTVAAEETAAPETPIVVDEVVASPEAVFAVSAEPVELEPIVASVDPVVVDEVPVAPVEEEIPAEVVVRAESVELEPIAAFTEPVVVDDVPVAPVVEEVIAEEVIVEEETSDDALARVLASVQLADQQTLETEEVIDDVADLSAPEEDEVVDDLGMESYDDTTASSFDNLISVRLNKVGLEEAINLFAQLSGANIIVPELTEAAQISVNLKDVEWRPALQSILDSYNYELYQRVSGSNVYSVRRRPAGAPVPQVVETFKLNYATVPNAAALIRQLLPADAKVSEFASRNMIVVKSSESSLSEVRSVLSSIDTVRQQVYIESKFMELSDGAQKDLGIDWQMFGAYGAGVSIEAAGMGREDVSGTPSKNLVTDMIAGSTAASAAGNAEYAILTSVLDVNDFQVVMSALEEKSGVNVVSNPKIIVANEQLANISIVTKEPNLKQSRQKSLNDTEDTITYELDTETPFFSFGIELDVTPSINTSSNITVKINPSLTRKIRDKKDESPDSKGNDLLSYPVISEKSIETVFSLTSGQTAAIGGLTEVSESDIERKVPVLGSIPLLGRLFSWEQTVSDQNETIIFVTVGLANTQQIDAETGLPEDAELSRRRVISERNKRAKREQDRLYYKIIEDERLEDALKAMKQQEERRTELRMQALLKQAQKAEQAN